MSVKKILHVVSTVDFIEHFLYDNIVYFSNQSYSFVVACSPHKLLNELSEMGGFETLPINIYRSYSPLADIIAVFKLRKEIRKYRFDIVIGHTPKGALLSMIAAKLAHVKVRVYYRHGILYQTASGINRVVLKYMEKLTCRCSTLIINVSKTVEEFAHLNNLNNPLKNIFLGTNGSCGALNPYFFSNVGLSSRELESFRRIYNINTTDIVIGFIGRMVNDKGINDLVNAWDLVVGKYDNVKLILAGAYEDRDSLPQVTKINPHCAL